MAHFAPEWVVQFKTESLAQFHRNTHTICKSSDFKYNYRIPGYVLGDVISVAKQALNPDGYQNKWLKEEFESGRPIALYRHFASWLRAEAQFFEDQGCGNSLDYFEEILSKAGEELSNYYP